MKRTLIATAILLSLVHSAPAQSSLPTTNAVTDGILTELWVQDALLQTNVTSLYGIDGTYRGKLSTDDSKVRSFDAEGGYRGQAKKTKEGWSFFDQQQNYLGKARKGKAMTTFYTGGGNYSGKAIRKGKATHYYDTDGTYLGKTVRDINGNFRYYGARGKRAGDINQ